jgi:hypothetical protein
VVGLCRHPWVQQRMRPHQFMVADHPGLGGAWSGLDTGNGSSGIDGSGELDDGRAAGDSSGFARKWLS